MHLQIVIPMAGSGSRFSQAGYTDPKPLIDVMGKPMIQAVVDNLGSQHKYVFVMQSSLWQSHQAQLTQALSHVADKHFVFVDGLTQGAAETCLKAFDRINLDQPLMIANCDQIMDWHADQFYSWFESSHTDGCILTFNADSIKHSYVQLDAHGFITQAAEKQVISNWATVGVYLWRKAQYFKQAADAMMAKNIRTNNEFYVCPTYNENVLMGHKVNTYHISTHWPIGTPEELHAYLEQMKDNS